ncbi:MAG: hypothetical protein M3P91_01590 [Actinomycetota bacterium]|nr:hypothetical protein [Actinomycetota bacterium]
MRPGIIPLRPLGVGEMLDGAFACMRRYPVATLGLAAVVSALSELAAAAFVAALMPAGSLTPGSSAVRPGQLFGDMGAVQVLGLVSLLLSLAAGLIFTGMLTAIMGRAILGQQVTLGSAWAAIRPRLGTLFAIVLLTTGLLLLVLLALLIPAGVSFLAVGPGPLTFTLLFVGGLLALGAGWHLYVALHFATSVAVLERSGATTALRRSRALVRGNWGRVAGILLLTGLLAGLISGLIGTPFQALTLILFGDEALTLPGLMLSAVGGILGGTIAAPIASGVSVLLYVDRRVRAEGLDLALQRAASAAPSPFGGTSPPAGTASWHSGTAGDGTSGTGMFGPGASGPDAPGSDAFGTDPFGTGASGRGAPGSDAFGGGSLGSGSSDRPPTS